MGRQMDRTLSYSPLHFVGENKENSFFIKLFLIPVVKSTTELSDENPNLVNNLCPTAKEIVNHG